MHRARRAPEDSAADIAVQGSDADHDGGEFSPFVWDPAGGAPIRNERHSMGEIPAKSPLSESISAALKQRGFKFVGPVIVYAWMQGAGIVNDHVVGCFRRDLLPLDPSGTAVDPPLRAG